MAKVGEILEIAKARGREMNLPYGGALLPQEAYALMQNAPGAKLIDVRCKAEIDWVGRIPGAIEIEWKTYPGMQQNQNFLSELEGRVDRNSLALFICRSGARSHSAAAAATDAGFSECYNVLEGFEGDKDPDKHRSTTNGWRYSGLPWEQG